MDNYNYNNSGLTKEAIAYLKYSNDCLASCACKKTIWKLYSMTPPNGRFTLQILSASSEKILNSTSFLKDDAEKKAKGEASLSALIAQIYRIHGQGYPYPRIAAEFTYGFGIAYTVRVYVGEQEL